MSVCFLWNFFLHVSRIAHHLGTHIGTYESSQSRLVYGLDKVRMVVHAAFLYYGMVTVTSNSLTKLYEPIKIFPSGDMREKVKDTLILTKTS